MIWFLAKKRVKDTVVRAKPDDMNGVRRSWHTLKHRSSSYKGGWAFPFFFWAAQVPVPTFSKVRLLPSHACVKGNQFFPFLFLYLHRLQACGGSSQDKKIRHDLPRLDWEKRFPAEAKSSINAFTNLIRIYSGLPVDIKWPLPNDAISRNYSLCELRCSPHVRAQPQTAISLCAH